MKRSARERGRASVWVAADLRRARRRRLRHRADVRTRTRAGAALPCALSNARGDPAEHTRAGGRDRIANVAANTYVETAVRNVLALAQAADRPLRGAIAVTVLGANDFYSQRDEVRMCRPAPAATAMKRTETQRARCGAVRCGAENQLARRGLPLSTVALQSLPAFFVPEHATATAVKKTGLGSSAALITSLVAALLAHMGVVTAPLSCVAAFARRHQANAVAAWG